MADKTKNNSSAEQNQALFVQLVTMLYGAAMQQMGKVVNPLTNKIEKNLEHAKLSIDMLSMVEEKTRGNLSDEEPRFLADSLFQLRMNYVDEVKKTAEGEKEAPKEEKKEEE
ncbi:MAG: DUF1844 domain-containing protein [Candidatus Latescibacteria bacterium]|nr:DUF1844 domain-containing protein [Candidatus Latescibacterota bacterium]